MSNSSEISNERDDLGQGLGSQTDSWSRYGHQGRDRPSGLQAGARPRPPQLTFPLFLQKERFLEERQSQSLVTPGKRITLSPGREPLFPVETLTWSSAAHCKPSQMCMKIVPLVWDLSLLPRQPVCVFDSGLVVHPGVGASSKGKKRIIGKKNGRWDFLLLPQWLNLKVIFLTSREKMS